MDSLVNQTRTGLLTAEFCTLEIMSSFTNQRKTNAEELVMKCTNQFPKCPVISTEELSGLMGETKTSEKLAIILVDVRTKEERDVSMIPSAIDIDEFEKLLNSNPDKYKEILIVPYCTVGYRSGKYATSLIENHGLKNVRNGEGIILWTYGETVLVKKDLGSMKVVKIVHTFGSAWDLAAEGYSTVQFGMFNYVYRGIAALFA